MADTTKGTIVWRGDRGRPPGNLFTTRIAVPLSKVKMTDLAWSLKDHTICLRNRVTFLDINSIGDYVPGAGANVDKVAVLYFRDPTTGGVGKISIPCLIAADIENTPNGERVTSTAMTTIIGLLNTATGKSYTPLYGIIKQVR